MKFSVCPRCIIISHTIHDHSYLLAMLGCENVVQKSRLAGAKISYSVRVNSHLDNDISQMLHSPVTSVMGTL